MHNKNYKVLYFVVSIVLGMDKRSYAISHKIGLHLYALLLRYEWGQKKLHLKCSARFWIHLCIIERFTEKKKYKLI